MCGRLVLTSSIKQRIADIFDGLDVIPDIGDRFNVTPSQTIYMITNTDSRRVQPACWGFPPATPSSRPHVNARGETVRKLPTFRDAFVSRRCIVIAEGFYEWKRDMPSSRPQPFYFYMRDHSVMLAAGLWNQSANPDNNQDEKQCLIVTTEANSLMHPIHHRIPVLFSPDSARAWLDTHTSPDTLEAMLQPIPSDRLSMHPVSQRVNKRNEDDRDLINPVQILEQTSLF